MTDAHFIAAAIVFGCFLICWIVDGSLKATNRQLLNIANRLLDIENKLNDRR